MHADAEKNLPKHLPITLRQCPKIEDILIADITRNPLNSGAVLSSLGGAAAPHSGPTIFDIVPTKASACQKILKYSLGGATLLQWKY